MVGIMKILITGAMGLLGHRIVKCCIEEGLEVCATDIVIPSLLGKEDGVTWLKMDITDPSSTISTLDDARPDAIINTAAMTNVDQCEVEKEVAWRINVEGARNVAQASAKTGAHLVHLSTSYVFDGEKGWYDEEDEPNPLGYYGVTKLRGEEAIKSTTSNWCIARTDVIFGWGRQDRPNFAQWVVINLEKKQGVKAVTDQYNSPTLNTNLAEMVVDIAKHHVQGILNTAGSTRINRFEFAKKISKIFHLDKNYIEPVSSAEFTWKAKRPKDASVNVAKAKKILSHKPRSIEDALKIMKKERTLMRQGETEQ
jgi:dTDP-4-dehydrorhamnose reductase